MTNVREPEYRKVLEDEVFGTLPGNASDAGSVRKPDALTSWSLRIRSFCNKLGAEANGIERIPPEARTNQPPWELFSLLFSANAEVSTLALGVLGPSVYFLGWWDSFLVVVFFNLLTAIPAALITGLGPRLGLRTMTIARYSFGWWPAKLMACINVITQLGWAIVNTLAAALVLYDVGDENLPLSVAVLILGLVSVVVGLFGYKMIHYWERVSWIIVMICLIIVAGFGGKSFVNTPWSSGTTEAANVLTFGSAIAGYQFAWLPIAADYCTYMKEDMPPWKPVMWSYLGLAISQIFIELLGVALALTVVDPAFANAYDIAGVGGLVGQCFEGYGTGARGFGKFIEVILSFSAVAVVITNIYSLGLSTQVVSSWALKVPRLMWSLIGAVIFLACAIAGRDHLSEVLENFLLILAYILTPFISVLGLEHFIFRRRDGYDVTAWNNPKKLPLGAAALFSWAVGFVIAFLCMSQVWYVGPIALAISYNDGKHL